MMKTAVGLLLLLTTRFSLPAVAAIPPNSTHICGVSDSPLRRLHFGTKRPLDSRNYAQSARADLNKGAPRTVRMIYFLPNDRPYRAGVVQKMKETMLAVQTFYAEQMEAHGYGDRTFRIETDAQGEPVVNRVDGRYGDTHYLGDTRMAVFDEIDLAFDRHANVYFIVIDNSTSTLGGRIRGVGGRLGKNGGFALVGGDSLDLYLVAHELGHGWGFLHDFRDGSYIMSYGSLNSQADWSLSKCHGDMLSVHPYFNPNISPIDDEGPIIEVISQPRYSAGATNVSIRLKVSDSDGVHQLFLHATQPNNRNTVKTCRVLGGRQEAVVAFDYDGIIPSAHDLFYSESTSLFNPLVHPIDIEAIDTDGNVNGTGFLLRPEAVEPVTKISGDNQKGVPNTPLPLPFVVEVLNVNSGHWRAGVSVTFSVITGAGALSATHMTTDWKGQAQSTLTLGPNLGINTVEVLTEGSTVTFNAVAGNPVEIPDPNLRKAVEPALNVASGKPIAPADMLTLRILGAGETNISDLTGLETATNLISVRLSGNTISNLSALVGLTRLRWLFLSNNAISDISALSGLTNLSLLYLHNNNISDLSPLVANTGLGSGDTVNVRGNPLNAESINTHITTLQGRGVKVLFDAQEPVNIPDPNLRAAIESALGKASGATITMADMATLETLDASGSNASEEAKIGNLTGLETATNLRELNLWNNQITDISALKGLTNLYSLSLGDNSISDISSLAGLTNLTWLTLFDNSISDISALSGLTTLRQLYLGGNQIVDISVLAGLTKLGLLRLGGISGNSISDISALGGLTNLYSLSLNNNSISDISALSGLTNLTELFLEDNSISDISVLAGLTKLRLLRLGGWLGNSISDISALSGLTNLESLSLRGNQIADISTLVGLTNLESLSLGDNSISDISPLVANTGLGEGDRITLDENPLNYTSINTHIPALQQRGVEVSFYNLKPLLEEFTLSIPAGTHAIHIPLKVSQINGADGVIEAVGDLYDALGDAVALIITIGADGNWTGYLGGESAGSPADTAISDDTGLIVVMKSAAMLTLVGEALSTGGVSQINIRPGNNLVGMPLDPAVDMMISDLLGEGVLAIAFTKDAGDGFHTITAAGQEGDGPIMGGVAYLVIATTPGSISIEGTAWSN